MSDFALLVALLSLGVGITCGILIKRLQDGFGALEESYAEYNQHLTEVDAILSELRGECDDLKLSVDNMRATSGPLPPVLLRRPKWAQDEMSLELQPSESAAIIARQEAIEQVIAVYEDRLGIVERNRDSRQIEARITAVAMEIRRHMTANRSDFEMQALRRITYCEEHVDLVTRRFDEAELTNFTKNPDKKTRPKRKK